MDELAVALGMDPIELRRVNDIRESPVNGARFTSRSLMQCYDEAAASFGWSRRDPKPGSMRDGNWLIGYGCATASYPTHMGPAIARVSVRSGGGANIEVAGHDSGQGTYTVLAQIAAGALSLDSRRIRLVMGDSRLPAGPASSNSMSTALLGSATSLSDGQDPRPPGKRSGGGCGPRCGLRASRRGRHQRDRGVRATKQEARGPGEAAQEAGAVREPGGGRRVEGRQAVDVASGAEFVEVRIHRLTRELRVPRMTGAFAAGQIVNQRTARSQYVGGMIWGLGSALLEATEIDEKRGRYVNDNLGEYLTAVNADAPPLVDVIMVPEGDDEINPIRSKASASSVSSAPRPPSPTRSNTRRAGASATFPS